MGTPQRKRLTQWQVDCVDYAMAHIAVCAISGDGVGHKVAKEYARQLVHARRSDVAQLVWEAANCVRGMMRLRKGLSGDKEHNEHLWWLVSRAIHASAAEVVLCGDMELLAYAEQYCDIVRELDSTKGKRLYDLLDRFISLCVRIYELKLPAYSGKDHAYRNVDISDYILADMD